MYINRIVIIALFVLFSSSVNATLISVDLNTSGDGLLTYDDRTSLEWLDIPIAYGRSYNDLIGIDGSDEFAAGGDFAGFRLASTVEVRSLFVDTLGIPLTDFAQWRPSSYAPVVSLHSFFGTTLGGDTAEIRAITSDASSGTAHWQSFARICQNNGLTTVCANENTANVNTNGTSAANTSTRTGAWIVRHGTTSVPEPTSLALMGFGLVGLGFARRKKTA